MKDPKIDFYSPTALKSYNLDKTMRYQLNVLGNLDFFTKRHSENVANLVCRICQYLNCNNSYTVYCTICAYLHDIGKMFIPLSILNKPDKLTPEEYEIMKTHTTLGYEMCIKDLELRPYAVGPLYHHEALNGTGYPNGVTKENIPYCAQIIRVADEYDAIVIKRRYTTHVNISETLRDLIKDARPDPVLVALDQLNENKKLGKINGKVLKVLFKVVIDDTNYEISCIWDYIKYLQSQIKRLELMESYSIKMLKATKEKTQNYYREGIRMLLQDGETFDNFLQVLNEYRQAVITRKDIIDKLKNEILIIKKLRV